MRTRRIVLGFTFAIATPISAQIWDPPQPWMCVRAVPALTYSAVAMGRVDPAWAVVTMYENGTATRPLLPARRSDRSRWKLRGDTLELVVFDGLVGWKMSVRPDSGGYSGTATYLTDAIAVGRPPLERAQRLERLACDPVTRHGMLPTLPKNVLPADTALFVVTDTLCARAARAATAYSTVGIFLGRILEPDLVERARVRCPAFVGMPRLRPGVSTMILSLSDFQVESASVRIHYERRYGTPNSRVGWYTTGSAGRVVRDTAGVWSFVDHDTFMADGRVDVLGARTQTRRSVNTESRGVPERIRDARSRNTVSIVPAQVRDSSLRPLADAMRRQIARVIAEDSSLAVLPLDANARLRDRRAAYMAVVLKFWSSGDTVVSAITAADVLSGATLSADTLRATRNTAESAVVPLAIRLRRTLHAFHASHP